MITEAEEPKWYDDFKVRGQIHLYVLGPASLLDGDVPKDAHGLGQVRDEKGEYLRQKTVREFVGGEAHINYEPAGKQVVFLACAMDAPCHRQKAFSEQDADDWKLFAGLVWGDKFTFLNMDKRNSILNEWNGEDFAQRIKTSV